MTSSEQHLAVIAHRQAGVFSRSQATELLGRSAVAHRVRTGRWVLVGPRVLAAATSVLGPDARCWSAVLTLGPRTLLSHRTAGWLWGLPVTDDGVVELLTTGSRTPGNQGVRVRRQSCPPEDRTLRAGLPVTTRERTLVDCLAVEPLDSATRLVDAAWRDGLITPSRLSAHVERRRGWAGTDQLRLLVDPLRSGRRPWTPYYGLAGTLREAGLVGWVRDLLLDGDGAGDGGPVVPLGHPGLRLALHVPPRFGPEPAGHTRWTTELAVRGWRVLVVDASPAYRARQQLVALVVRAGCGAPAA